MDLSAQMALFALCLRRIAALLGEATAEARFAAEHAAIGAALNALCWDDQAQFYFDLGYGQRIPRMHVGGFWPLLAELVPAERVDGLVAHLTNPREFGVLNPVPALARSDRDYDASGLYWRGGVWAPTTYMVLRGLEAAGRRPLAVELARKIHATVARVFADTGTFWENYAPEAAARGAMAKPDFCGWSAIFPIAVWKEYL